MEIKINVLEVASELADLAVRREMCDNESLEEGDGEWEKVYKKKDEIISYTEEAQDVFNRWYDYYFDMLTDKMIE